MEHAWIIDVLKDLQVYTRDNELEAMSEQLSQVSETAETIIKALIEEQDAETHAA